MPSTAIALSTACALATSVLLGCSSTGSLVASSDPPDGTDGSSPPSDVATGEISDATAGETSALACSVMDPTSCPDPAPHYADVAPIFQSRCVSCHSGDSGPWPLTDYGSILAWEDIVRSDLLGCTMPPPDAGISMTRDEQIAILTWIRCALPP